MIEFGPGELAIPRLDGKTITEQTTAYVRGQRQEAVLRGLIREIREQHEQARVVIRHLGLQKRRDF